MNCKHNYARVNEPRAYSDSMINRGRTAAHHRRSESQPHCTCEGALPEKKLAKHMVGIF